MTPTDILSSAMRTLFILGKEEAEKAAQEEHEKTFMEYSKLADLKDALEKELELTTKEKERLSQEVDRLETELNSQRADAARDAAVPEQAWSARVRQMQETIYTYEARIEELRKTLYAAKEWACENLPMEQDEDFHDRIEQAFRKAHAKAKDAGAESRCADEFAAYGEKLHSMKSELEGKQNELDQREEDMKMLRELLDARETELKAAQDLIDELRQENTRLRLCVPEFKPNPVLDLSKVNFKPQDYEKLRERFKNLDDLTTRYTDDKGLEMLRKYLDREYHAGDYVTGNIAVTLDEHGGGDRFTGIIRDYGDEYVTFFALHISDLSGKSKLLIHSEDYPEATILFHSKNLTVAACGRGVTLKRPEIGGIGKADSNCREKLDKIMTRHGYSFDGLRLRCGVWDGVNLETREDGRIYITG